MRRAPTTCPPIQKYGTGRDEAFDAIEARLAADATYMIRRLIAERGWDLEDAVDAYLKYVQAIVARAVADGRARVVRSAEVRRLTGRPRGVT